MSLNYSCLKHQLRERGVAGLIPDGDIFFILNFLHASSSSHLEGTRENEIKHDHSPVVYVVIDPRYD